MMVIRKATMDDFEEVQLMNGELTASDMQYDKALVTGWAQKKDGIAYLKRRIRGRKGICFVAEEDDKVVGYACGGLLPIQEWRPVRRAELDNLYVRDPHKGKGIGKKLLDTFISWSKEMGVDRVMLIAVATNQHALRFYSREHFAPEHVMLEKKI